MKDHDDLMNNQNLTDQKSEVFIFRYDLNSSFEDMFEEFWEAVDGKNQSINPHIVRSNSIEALSTNMTKNRLQMFEVIAEKKPNNILELAGLLHKDYNFVRREVHILVAMGIVKLGKVKKVKGGYKSIKPIALYKRIIFDFPIGFPTKKPINTRPLIKT